MKKIVGILLCVLLAVSFLIGCGIKRANPQGGDTESSLPQETTTAEKESETEPTSTEAETTSVEETTEPDYEPIISLQVGYWYTEDDGGFGFAFYEDGTCALVRSGRVIDEQTREEFTYHFTTADTGEDAISVGNGYADFLLIVRIQNGVSVLVDAWTDSVYEQHT